MKKRTTGFLWLPVLFLAMQLFPGYAQGKIESRIALERKSERYARQFIVAPVLGMPTYMSNVSYLIDMNEYEELQLDDVVKHLDCAQTSFGTWGFQRHMFPITDRSIIDQRVASSQHLVEDSQLYLQIERLLEEIWKLEPNMIAYFVDDNVMSNIKRLYYDLPFTKDDSILPSIGIMRSLQEFLNNNSIALEGALYVDTAKAAISLGKVFMIQGIIEEWKRWELDANPNKEGFDFKKALKRSTAQLIRDHNPKLEVLKHGYDAHSKNSFAQWLRATFEGTLGDRYKAMSEWYTFDDSIKIFSKEIPLKQRPSSAYPKAVQGAWKVLAGPGALFQTLWDDYSLYLNAKSAFEKVSFLYKVNGQLKDRMIKIARFVRVAQKLAQCAERDQYLRSLPLVQNFACVFGSKASKKLQKALKLLNSSTFNANSSFYMRGRMLLAHKLLNDIKEELVPMLQAIGELDALVSTARIYKQHEKEPLTCTFVQFDDSHQPIVDIQDGWLCSLQNPVVNDIEIGGTQQNHFLLTGPNGAGKSTILKMIGQNVCLGHSIGLVPASYARMSFMFGLRTSLEPSENLKKGLSSFMAENKSMDEIYAFISSCPSDKKCIVLIDEPYRGTVSHETARLDGKFCSFVTDKTNTLTGIATHIMPILAYPKAWAFYHVEILDAPQGEFKKTFKLLPGKADWWFNDDTRRAQYVDWLGNYKKPLN